MVCTPSLLRMVSSLFVSKQSPHPLQRHVPRTQTVGRQQINVRSISKAKVCKKLKTPRYRYLVNIDWSIPPEVLKYSSVTLWSTQSLLSNQTKGADYETSK